MTVSITDEPAVTDSTLLEWIRHGRVDALAELYARYAAATWFVACVVLGPDQAEAVVVEVFAELWHSPSAIRGEEPRDTRLPLVCRLLDGALRRSLARRPGAIRDREIELICGFASRERAAFVLTIGGTSRAQAGDAIGKSSRAVTLMLRDTLSELQRARGEGRAAVSASVGGERR